MKRTFIFGLLVFANLALLGWLAVGIKQRIDTATLPRATGDTQIAAPLSAVRDAAQNSSAASPDRRAKAPEPATPFTRVYSSDLRQFAANLRAIHCPEETVKDILLAEMHRRFKSQEDALRQKPGDHVPYGWSAKTTEPKLLERRQQAAALAREQAAMLRDALGYDVPVPMPLYAMTTGDQRFEETIAAMTPEKRAALQQVQEKYWADAQALQQRTRGFWLTEDVAELSRLKAERQRALQALVPQQ